jgi:hypothetical protein
MAAPTFVSADAAAAGAAGLHPPSRSTGFYQVFISVNQV